MSEGGGVLGDVKEQNVRLKMVGVAVTGCLAAMFNSLSLLFMPGH